MNIKESVDLIESYLDLDRKPVGIKFFFNKEEFLNFEVPQRERKVTYCNSVQLASIGKSMKLSGANQGCPNGAFAMKFIDIPTPIASGKGRYNKGMYKNEEISKSINDDMLFLDEKLEGMAVMPLENFQEQPDIIIVIGDSYNIMRLIQGHAYHNGYTNNLRTVGLQAVCQDLTTYPYLTQDINISLLCPGTRLVADWKPNEIGIGIPFKKWYEMVDGVIETTNPFERNNNKRAIIERLKAKNLNHDEIKVNTNYDDKTYSGGKINIEK